MIIQLGIANMLGIPANRVTVHVKRIGCNYGGKQVRALPHTFAVALAASIAGQPVRSVLTRTQDIMMTGQRGEFTGQYKVGVTNSRLRTSCSTRMVGGILMLPLKFFCYKFP